MAADRLLPGATVQLVARPGVIGVVTGSRDMGGVLRYEVFHDNAVHGYYETQVREVEGHHYPAKVSAAEVRSGLTSELLLDKNTGYLHARNVGRIDYEPYQYRPVLKIVQADRPRILVADDVGVGKTIEACLILKELQARQRASSVLIICPKPLVVDGKWRSELKRFDEDFVHLDSASLRFCLEETMREGRWPSRYEKAILPYSLLDERLLTGRDAEGRTGLVGLADLAPGPHFDLVIVDEAHHIRNRPTFAYQNVKRLADAADALVLLSATPVQTDSRDLFTLVNLLRDDLVPTERDFAQMLEPNQYILEAVTAARGGNDGWHAKVRAALHKVVSTPWGQQVMSADPRLAQVLDLLVGDPRQARERVRVVRALEDLNTFSAIVTRTRRRDIGSFTTRKPSAQTVGFTSEQQAVYDAVIAVGRRIAERQAPGMSTEFLLSMLRRQAASSINGLAPLVEELLANRLDRLELVEMDDAAPDVGLDEVDELREAIRGIGAMAAGLQGSTDAKAEVLRHVVEDKQADSNNKVLVFSTFRHTLRYLEQQALNWDVRAAVMHGAVPDEERRAFRQRFKLPRTDPAALDVLLCSEIGTEGLDYQFCNTLVNYDIPWNPMRVEQRIGRIDRRGQQSDTVAIVNILTEGTVEADIYDRCLLRIGVFHRALGGSEEILGDLTTELRRIADNLTLSDAERNERLRQLADNEISRVQELERLEDQQSELLGLTTESFEARVAEASSEWFEADKICDLVRAYFENLVPTRRFGIRPGKIAVIRLDDESAQRVIDDLRSTGNTDPRLERALRQSPTALRVTADQDLAADQVDVLLLGATQPLVRTAAAKSALRGAAFSSLRVRSNLVAPGRYSIAVHAWTRLDARDTLTLRYISTDAAVEAVAGALLVDAFDDNQDDNQGDGPLDVDRAMLDERHHLQWKEARMKHVTRAHAAATQRAASLRAQRDRQLQALAQTAGKVSDPRIVKMRESEAAAARSKFDRLIEEQERAAVSADLVTRQLITAVLVVEAQ